MRKVLTALAVLAALASGVQAGGIYRDYDTAFKAANASGKPLLVVYTCPTSCPKTRSAIYYMLRSVNIKASVHPHFEVVEIGINGRDARYRRCRAKITGVLVPFWAVVTPDDRVVMGGDYNTVIGRRRGHWPGTMLGVAAKHPALSMKTRQEAAKALEQAKEDFEMADYVSAFDTAGEIAEKIWFPAGLNNGAKALLKDIDKRGEELLKEAASLSEGTDVVKALLTYERIKCCFGNKTAAGKKALYEQRMVLRRAPSLGPLLRDAKSKVWADHLLAIGKALEAKKKTDMAIRKYRLVVVRYAGTAAAKEADSAIARLTAKPNGPGTKITQTDEQKKPPPAKKTAAPPRDDESKAALLLSMGRNYHAAGKNDLARDNLVACIRKYPNTEAAAEACRLIIEWGIEMPD